MQEASVGDGLEELGKELASGLGLSARARIVGASAQAASSLRVAGDTVMVDTMPSPLPWRQAASPALRRRPCCRRPGVSCSGTGRTSATATYSASDRYFEIELAQPFCLQAVAGH